MIDKYFGEILRESFAMSQKTGFAPAFIIQEADAIKLLAVTMTSS